MDLALTALQFYHRCRLRVFLIFFLIFMNKSNFLCFVVESMRKDFMKNLKFCWYNFQRSLKLPRINQRRNKMKIEKRWSAQFVWACTLHMHVWSLKTLGIVWEKRMTCHIILLTIQLARKVSAKFNSIVTQLFTNTKVNCALVCWGFFIALENFLVNYKKFLICSKSLTNQSENLNFLRLILQKNFKKLSKLFLVRVNQIQMRLILIDLCVATTARNKFTLNIPHLLKSSQ